MKRFDGKVAIVVGVSNSGNIGQAIARRFASLGADLVVCGRDEAKVMDVGDELGVSALRCDITSAADLETVTRFAHDRYGHVDIAINAVGVNLVKPFLDVTRAELDKVVTTQFIGTFLFMQAMMRAMDPGGSIIQISSVTSTALLTDHAAYMATKAAGDMLVRSVAFDFGWRGIRVNSLSPGATADAPMAAEFMQDPSAREKIRRGIPLGRVGTTLDVADAAVWLAGDECFVTGENIQVNGGAGMHALQPPPTGA